MIYKVIGGVLHCQTTIDGNWTPIYKTRKEVDRELIQSFLSLCEQEVLKANFEAQTAITERATINLN